MKLVMFIAALLSAAQSSSASPAPPSAPPATSSVPTAPPATSAVPSSGAVCVPSLAHVEDVYRFTTTDDFKDLSDGQQILVYELLAAGEACLVREFISPDTTALLLDLVDGASG